MLAVDSKHHMDGIDFFTYFHHNDDGAVVLNNIKDCSVIYTRVRDNLSEQYEMAAMFSAMLLEYASGVGYGGIFSLHGKKIRDSARNDERIQSIFYSIFGGLDLDEYV